MDVINIPNIHEGEGSYATARLVDENGVEYLAEFAATDEFFQDTDTPYEIDAHFGEETQKCLFQKLQKLEEASTPTIH
jgi:hypothetical protein